MHDDRLYDDVPLYCRLWRRCPLRGGHLPLLHLPSPDEDHDRDRLPGQHYVAGCCSPLWLTPWLLYSSTVAPL